MDKKIIALDLDGTLLNSEGITREETKNYLKKLKEKGHIITIATGRILYRALIGTDGAEFADYIVSDAGAAVFKNKETNWEKIYTKPIEKEITEEIASYYNKNKFMTVNICSKDMIHHYDSTINIKEFLKNIDEIIHVSVSCINNEITEEYFKIFTEKFSMLKIEIMQDSFAKVKWLEIFQKDIEKYKGITEIARLEEISNENIIAFGDGLNDVEMLKKCGIGVAMKNALPEVKEQADYITSKTNNENGVVEFLKEYLVDI